jgi:hypothetical protein
MLLINPKPLKEKRRAHTPGVTRGGPTLRVKPLLSARYAALEVFQSGASLG